MRAGRRAQGGVDAELGAEALHQRAQLRQLGRQPRLLGLQRGDLAGRHAGLAGARAAAASTATSPHSRCAQRASRAPGARGSLTHARRLLASASSSRKPSTDEMSAKRCSRSQFSAQLGRGLRAAQHQHREQRHRLRRAAPARAPCCARSATTRLPLPSNTRLSAFSAVDRGQHLGLGGVDHRVARGLLVAAGDQRVQRQRVGVGHGVLLSRPARRARAPPAAVSARIGTAQTPKPSSAGDDRAVDEVALVGAQHHQHRVQVLRLADALARQHLRSASGRPRSASGGG